MDAELSLEQIVSLVDVDRLPLALLILGSGWLGLAVTVRLLDDLGERFTDRRLAFKKTKALLRFFVYLALTIVVPLSALRETGWEALLPLAGAFTFGRFALKDLVGSLVSGVLLWSTSRSGRRSHLLWQLLRRGDRDRPAVCALGHPDDNLVTIPNGQFLTDSVASPTRVR